jgi:hypothetical protein
MQPQLKDEVVARIEDGGVIVERRGVIVGRSITGRDNIRYDVYFPDSKDPTKRFAINLEAKNVRLP